VLGVCASRGEPLGWQALHEDANEVAPAPNVGVAAVKVAGGQVVIRLPPKTMRALEEGEGWWAPQGQSRLFTRELMNLG
jgi:hypothetical protein